ncbi:hypothetical protein BDV95DRAFT_9161 [Massariosphaeria phaeospora]|uniref:F-box domain-containing protein n=1 Tax=Massariosphaeria phaeospora TaxID=100035 RepID=A0A7C8IF33_9PLEO|nr:hypothetical protein BDV95DRAFT_9161 [Massariosphaeria phaeospora]
MSTPPDPRAQNEHRSSQSQSALAGLPVELLHHIVSFVTYMPSLVNLSLTCSCMLLITDEHLYQTYRYRAGSHGYSSPAAPFRFCSVPSSLIKTLILRPKLRKLVKELDYEFTWNSRNETRPDDRSSLAPFHQYSDGRSYLHYDDLLQGVRARREEAEVAYLLMLAPNIRSVMLEDAGRGLPARLFKILEAGGIPHEARTFHGFQHLTTLGLFFKPITSKLREVQRTQLHQISFSRALLIPALRNLTLTNINFESLFRNSPHPWSCPPHSSPVTSLSVQNVYYAEGYWDRFLRSFAKIVDVKIWWHHWGGGGDYKKECVDALWAHKDALEAIDFYSHVRYLLQPEEDAMDDVHLLQPEEGAMDEVPLKWFADFEKLKYLRFGNRQCAKLA